MLVDVAVYHIGPHHNRSTLICNSLMAGIRRAGDRPRLLPVNDYVEPVAPVAAFYGLQGKLEKIFADYQKDGRKAVYVDLGYFGRHEGGRWAGYHKLSVNSRHPTAYFQARKHDSTRADTLHVHVRKWRMKGDHILLAGMGDKGAFAEGYRPEEWERSAIAELRKHTDRPIIYRPKPSWKDAKPIEGVQFSHHTQQLNDVLRGCYAVVTHHSNVAVDGLVGGIPAFCMQGAAVPMALQDLSKIEEPVRPEGRLQWLWDLAYTQFSVAEIRRGIAWKHLKDEGLVP